MKSSRKATAVAGAVVTLGLIATACGSSSKTSSSTSAPAAAVTTAASKATSAAAFGGMSGLVKAAQQEGTLNVIADPNDWANYGNIMKEFTAKYGIKINSENPDGSSQDEINAVKQLKRAV